MLRCNIDMNAGFVNGAISTVFCLSDMVQFVEKVKSRLKSFYIYRRHFPLILAYAVTSAKACH